MCRSFLGFCSNNQKNVMMLSFCLQVDSKEKYEILMKIKEALDLMEHVTPEQKEAYNKKEAQLASL